jgi:pimeloyl-ACP methyl ester carboxylesterase
MRLILPAAFIALLLCGMAQAETGQDSAASGETESNSQTGRFNIPSPTLGGKQLWSDELVFRDWRIQRHVITGHYRLLDDENHRRAWGTFDQCREKLDALKQKLDLPPVTGKVVIVLHGLGRSRSSMTRLCKYLAQHGDFTVLNVSYASTRSNLDVHAVSLAHVIKNLDAGVGEINFVAHSLGNLVIRRYLADCYRNERGLSPDPRIGRIVMLAPPNTGARIAELFKNVKSMEWVLGDSAVDLAKNWGQLQKKLATPKCPFGIIAGGQGDRDGRNRLLQGDDDLVVRVEETKLAGARDFAVLPVYHGWIMNDPLVREYTLRFLNHGHFISETARKPITDQKGVKR